MKASLVYFSQFRKSFWDFQYLFQLFFLKVNKDSLINKIMNRNKKSKKNLGNLLPILGILFSLTGGALATCSIITKNRLYNELEYVANTNGDNITDHKEWSNVYQLLGKNYNIHYSKPKKDLSVKEMRRYINFH